jgi:KipI family sensor histidine kinase inhibitor
MQAKKYPRFRHAADHAVIVEFGESIDLATNLMVAALDRNLEHGPISGVLETVPTYRSLCVCYDPLLIRSAALIEELRCRIPDVSGASGPGGRDLEDVARLNGLTTEEVVTLHSQAHYRVYMIGFMPGYAYLGGLPKALHTSRLSRPRPSEPRGSVAIGGTQTSIFSVQSPCGWRVVGHTPLRLFDPARNPAILIHTGDEIRFEPVSASRAEQLEKISEAGGIPASYEVLG